MNTYQALLWIALLSLLGLVVAELICRWIIWYAREVAREATKMKTGIVCQFCRHGELDVAQSEYGNEVILSCTNCDVVKRFNFKEAKEVKKDAKPKNG